MLLLTVIFPTSSYEEIPSDAEIGTPLYVMVWGSPASAGLLPLIVKPRIVTLLALIATMVIAVESNGLGSDVPGRIMACAPAGTGLTSGLKLALGPSSVSGLSIFNSETTPSALSTKLPFSTYVPAWT